MSKKLTMANAVDLYHTALHCAEQLKSKPEILGKLKAAITQLDAERVAKYNQQEG